MNILETLLNSQSGGSVQQAGQKLGLDASNTQALLGQLLPALTGGIQKNLIRPGGLNGLTKALAGGNHQRYLDDPAALQDESAVTDGNAILGHLLGGKEESREVASQAAAQTGLDVGMIKKFLPVLAAAAMGALSKQTGAGSKLSAAGGGAGSLLTGLLGAGNGGGAVEKLFSLGKKFL